MQHEGTVVREEQDAIMGTANLLEHPAIVRMHHAGKDITGLYAVTGLSLPHIDACMVSLDGDEIVLIDKRGEITGSSYAMLHHIDAGEETQDGSHSLTGVGGIDAIGMSGIEAEG